MIENDTDIVSDIKKMLGVEESVSEFDIDIESKINSAFFTLYQLGVGLNDPIIIDSTTMWSEFDTTVPKEIIREYLYLKVKTVFDPPSSSFVMEAEKDRISELEFRINIYVDNGGGITNG